MDKEQVIFQMSISSVLEEMIMKDIQAKIYCNGSLETILHAVTAGIASFFLKIIRENPDTQDASSQSHFATKLVLGLQHELLTDLFHILVKQHGEEALEDVIYGFQNALDASLDLMNIDGLTKQ